MDAQHDLLDVDHLLDDEERAIRDTARRFAQERLAPHVAEWFEAGTLPARDIAREMGQAGLLGMHLEGYGCAGVSSMAYGLASTELEAVDSGLRSLFSVQGSLAMYSIHAYGSEAQKEQWLPGMAAGTYVGAFGLTEPDHGSNPKGMRTRARNDGGDWILSGSKMWITNGSVADVVVVWAQTDEGVRGFVVPTDTPGFAATDIKQKMSMRASVTSELSLDDVRLPHDAVLPGAQGLRGPLGALNEARFGILFGATGAARSCVETALEYAQSRIQFDRPIAGFQLTQQKLADMSLEHGKALLLAVHLGRLKEAGRLSHAQVSAGKLNNTRVAIEIARTARTVLGANGVSGEYPIMRHANNLESVLTYEGTAEIHTLTIGRALTGISAFI
ncbi:acyl-CoA dehydrogenase family protein [Nocardioides deserti]|uniref:Acyl-CoA dehydrogenase family protein n=1 Tax=Nocardioides deserti TaxID=1588644 RepID=A0ABR6UCX5_9ACTN|nr:acyl-CoA dehydrogenase family protein [Nocardioides deserti]MBC2961988.1 acyl-CoA dehydrogenase family protein [Nocardioides deserti]